MMTKTDVNMMTMHMRAGYAEPKAETPTREEDLPRCLAILKLTPERVRALTGADEPRKAHPFFRRGRKSA